MQTIKMTSNIAATPIKREYNESPATFSNNVTGILNSTKETPLPKGNIIEEHYDISVKSEDLNQGNKSKQVKEIKSLLTQKHPEIKEEMINETMGLGHEGDLNGQKLQYQPETSLIILTLLDDKEINGSNVLEEAAKLINNVHKNLSNEEHLGKVIKTSQRSFEKALFDKVLGGGDIKKIENLIERFEKKYLEGAIKEKLADYLTKEAIEQLPIDKFFDSSLLEKKNKSIEEMKNQLIKHGSDESVNKLLPLHNIFSCIEEKIEIIGQLTVKVGTDDNTAKPVATNSPVEVGEDVVNSMPNKENSAPYFIQINNHDEKNSETTSLAPHQNKMEASDTGHDEIDGKIDSTLKDNDKPKDDITFINKDILSGKPAKEPTPDYVIAVDNPNDKIQDIDKNKNKDIFETETSGTRDLPITGEKNSPETPSTPSSISVLDDIRRRFSEAKDKYQKNGAIITNSPVKNGIYGSYLKNGQIPEGVILTGNRQLVQNKSTKPLVAQSVLSIKNADHFNRSYLENDNGRVVLSGEGLTTSNLVGKLNYEKASQR